MNLTLKEMAALLDNFDFAHPFNIVDIKMWDSDAGDFVDCLGFEDCTKLSDAVKRIGTTDYAGAEYLEWLDHIVTYVSVKNMANGDILEIEISA